MTTVEFAGVPLVRIIEARDGWQIQMRESAFTENWYDVDLGWFPTRNMAEEEAPYLCHF